MKVALIVLFIWTIIVVSIFGTVFDYYSAPFFSVGPSPNLYIVGINYVVDTWPKYCWIIIYTFVQAFVITVCGDSIYPWINAVVLNPQAGYITMSKPVAFMITNSMYLLFNLQSLLSTGIAYSQLGFSISMILGTTIGGCIVSGIRISKKEVKPIIPV